MRARLIAALILVSGGLLIATPASAQELTLDLRDPNLAKAALEAAQAEIRLRNAMIQSLREGTAKRDAELAAWFKGWFGAAAD